MLGLFLLTACGGSPRLVSSQPTPTQETSSSPTGLEPVIEISRLYGTPEQARFERISLAQGLSQSSIYSMLQDSKGFMWLGTQDGLNRYDGYRFTVFKPDPENPNSLSFDYILSLQQDRDGNLWIGTNGGGLNSLGLDTGLINHYPGGGEDHRSLSGNSVFAIHQDEEGILWFGTNRGLNRFDPDRKQFTLSQRVTVVPPFWQTWWFRGGIVLLLIGSILTAVRLRTRSIEDHNRELERQVTERTGTLAERSREIERRKLELEALYRADAELHRHLSLDQVLQALVDIAVDILQADKSALMAWDDRHEKLVVRVARGYSPETLSNMTFKPGNGTVGHVATTGQPVSVKNAHTDPRLSQPSPIIEVEGIRSFMQVPIKVSGEIFGVFSADYMQPRAFGTDEKRLFLSLAQRAALAIDTAQLHEKSQELAVLEERSRLARDLHDAVTQTLFSSSLIAETVPQLWDTDPEEGRQLLKELRQLSRGALAEMRTLLLELRPAALAETNLGELLRQLGEAVTGQMGTSVAVTVEGQCVLPSTVHIALYRIAQEALNNVVKHSAADHITINLLCTTRAMGDLGPRNQVELCIADDGQGFDPEHVPPDRLGLGIIRERIQSIGAALDIQSQPGHGTKVTVTWQEAEAR